MNFEYNREVKSFNKCPGVCVKPEYKVFKMEGLGQLIIFSLVMLVGSYGAGSAPLFMPMSEEKLHMVSVLGAGLLVGVAFAVIIPEGVLTLIKAYTLRSHSLQQRTSAGEMD